MNKLNRLEWTPELVSKFWDNISRSRLTEYSFSKQAGKSLIIAIKHLLRLEDKILDFGAGDGHLIQLLCERGYSVSGYEPSEERCKNLKTHLDKLTTFNGFVDYSSKNMFDVVVMAEVIEHILDINLDSTLEKLATFTKQDGYLIVTTPNNEDLELAMSYCPVSDLFFHRWQHVRSFTALSLAELLDKYGFEEIVTHEVEFNNPLYTPGDDVWGSKGENIPSYIKQIRKNIKTNMGGDKNLLYIGRKI